MSGLKTLNGHVFVDREIKHVYLSKRILFVDCENPCICHEKLLGKQGSNSNFISSYLITNNPRIPPPTSHARFSP